MSDYLEAYTSASSTLDTYLWMVKDMLGGIILTIIVLLVARIIFRAVLASLIGQSASKIGGGIFEIALVLTIVLQTSENPATVFTALGWSAAVFKKLSTGI